MKLKKITAIALMVFTLLLSVAGCGGTEYDNGTTIYEISLSKTEMTIEIGDTEKLHAQYGVDGKVAFSSSDERVATVDENGVVTGVSVGIAYIDVSFGTEKKICKVEVVKTEYSVAFDCGNLNMFVGASKEIYATVYKNGVASDLTVEWDVDNGGQLIANENIAVFSATSAGSFVVKAKYGEAINQIVITVYSDISAI